MYFPGLSGSLVCLWRERIGLKGSLSTYTLTENQSINKGRRGWDKGLDGEKRSRAERERMSRLLQGPAKLPEFATVEIYPSFHNLCMSATILRFDSYNKPG